VNYYGHPKFKEYTEEMVKVHSEKNHDYADQSDPLSNFRVVNELVKGIPDCPFKVAFTRLIEKILRISQIATKGNKVADETLSDSLMDGANYCILSRILIEEYGIEVDMSQEEVNHLMQKYRGNHDKGK
jgi:hypothetical protein